IRRGFIGVAGQTVPVHRRIVRYYNLENENAVLVVSVEPNSPASKAGVVDGDLILSFDGKTIESVDDLLRLLTDERTFKPAQMTLIRGTEKRELTITPVASGM